MPSSACRVEYEWYRADAGITAFRWRARVLAESRPRGGPAVNETYYTADAVHPSPAALRAVGRALRWMRGLLVREDQRADRVRALAEARR